MSTSANAVATAPPKVVILRGPLSAGKSWPSCELKMDPTGRWLILSRIIFARESLVTLVRCAAFPIFSIQKNMTFHPIIPINLIFL